MSRPDPARQLASPNRSVHLCILLLLQEGPAHGYGLLQRLSALSDRQHNRARIYRTLRWLEEAGFVACWWDTPPIGAARRMYKLRPAGTRALAAALPTLSADGPSSEDPVSRLILTLARPSRAS